MDMNKGNSYCISGLIDAFSSTDIKFTEFDLHTLMAAAILVTVYRTQPELLHWFEEQLEVDYFYLKKVCMDLTVYSKKLEG